MPVIDELITILGFDADTSEGNKFAKSLDNVKGAAIAVGSAILGAEAAVLAYTASVAASTDELGKFGASFGEDIERLQQWEFATERAGGKAGDLRADIASLSKTLASPIPGEFNQALAALGITVFDASGKLKSGGDVLDELIDKFDGLDAGQRQILATNVGISESTLRFIAQGRDEITRLSKLASDLGGVIPEEATAVAAEYADRMTDVNTLIGGIGRSLAISLLPGITRALWAFEQWGIANKELISQNLKEVVEGIGRGFGIVFDAVKTGIDFVAQLIPGLEGVTEELDIAQLVAVTFATAIGALAVAFAPAIAGALEMVAAIGAIALAIDDLVAFSQGKKSVIGDFLNAFLEKFPQAEGVINRIKELIQGFVDGVGPLFIGLGITIQNLWNDAGDSSTIFGSAVEGSINLVLGAIDLVLVAIQAIVDAITLLTALFRGDFQTAGQIVKESLGGAFDFVKTSISETFDFIVKLIDKAGEFLGLWNDLTAAIDTEAIGEKIDEVSGKAIEATKGFIEDQAEALADTGRAIGETAAAAKEGLSNFVGDQVEGLAETGRAIGRVTEDVFGLLGFGGGEAQAATAPVPTSRLGGTIPVTVAGGGRTVNNQGGPVSQTNNNTYNINGAQNPQAVANQISRTQARQQSELSNAAQFGAFQGIE